MPRHDSTRRKGYKETASQWVDTARHHPTATAVAAAGAAGAIVGGAYLWTKRNQISRHMRDWADKMQSSSNASSRKSSSSRATRKSKASSRSEAAAH